MALLLALSYILATTAVLATVACIALGLLFVCEQIELYPQTARIFGLRLIYVILLLHLFLPFTDSLPWLKTLFSILTHLSYILHLHPRRGPSPSNSRRYALAFLSLLLTLANHLLWLRHFSALTRSWTTYHTSARLPGGRLDWDVQTPTRRLPSAGEVIALFVCAVWAAPIFLFLRAVAQDWTLPISAPGPDPTGLSSARSPRRSLLASALSLLPSRLSQSANMPPQTWDNTNQQSVASSKTVLPTGLAHRSTFTRP